MEHAYRSSYEIWGEDGRIVVEWAYTPPAEHRPVLRIETQDRIDRRTLPADDQFGNVLAEFARSVRTSVPGDLEGRHVLRLAALFDEVAAAARGAEAVA
jgi:NDP-hexose-3-ketoreductase